jgi:hypothetical protein
MLQRDNLRKAAGSDPEQFCLVMLTLLADGTKQLHDIGINMLCINLCSPGVSLADYLLTEDTGCITRSGYEVAEALWNHFQQSNTCKAGAEAARSAEEPQYIATENPFTYKHRPASRRSVP